MGRFTRLFVLCAMLLPLLAGCAASGSTYQEGYYTAQAADLMPMAGRNT